MADILVIFSSTPHGNAASKDSLDFAMSATAYGHQVNAVFIDDGVFQLVEPSKSEAVYKTKQPSKIAKSLPFFDVDNIYVCQDSIDKRLIKFDAISTDCIRVEANQIRQLIEAHKFVVNLK